MNHSAVVRAPAVAGRFYPGDPEELRRQVASHCANAGGARTRAIACLVPHAGYRYSGHVAGAVYARLELPGRFLLLGPRHFPQGYRCATCSAGSWRTPLGAAEIDAGLADQLKRAWPPLRDDDTAHRSEHSLEVQLPFLQVLTGSFRFVPVVLGHLSLEELDSLGRAIAGVVARQAEPVLIIASSDMNHYESDAVTRAKDRLALERLKEVDPPGLYDTARREEISMCGLGPAVAALTAARELGAFRGEVVRYATSGDIHGSNDEVVGYAGAIIR